MEKNETNRKMVKRITKVAVLSTLAAILMFFETILPLMPPFLKIDLSEIPALIGAFALGPINAVIIELVKNLVHLVIPGSTTFAVGELANFVIGSFFVATAGCIYRYKKTKSGAILGMVAGTLAMTIVSCIANYFVMLPFYATLFHISMKDIVEMTAAVNGWVRDVKTLIVFAFVPFNLFKGIVASVITALFYKRISPLLHK